MGGSHSQHLPDHVQPVPVFQSLTQSTTAHSPSAWITPMDRLLSAPSRCTVTVEESGSVETDSSTSLHAQDSSHVGPRTTDTQCVRSNRLDREWILVIGPDPLTWPRSQRADRRAGNDRRPHTRSRALWSQWVPSGLAVRSKCLQLCCLLAVLRECASSGVLRYLQFVSSLPFLSECASAIVLEWVCVSEGFTSVAEGAVLFVCLRPASSSGKSAVP